MHEHVRGGEEAPEGLDASCSASPREWEGGQSGLKGARGVVALFNGREETDIYKSSTSSMLP